MHFHRWKRREFITLVGGAAAGWPLAAHAQQPAKRATVGYLGSNTPSAEGPRLAAFLQRLRDLGWVEGRTHRDRSSLGRGAQRALRRDRGRVRTAQGRCHRDGRNRGHRRGKAGDIHDPNRVCGVGRPGWDRCGRKPGAAGRQRHRPFDPGDRSYRQTARTFARGRARSPAVGDPGQWRRSRCRAGDARTAANRPHARARGHHVGNPAGGGYRGRLRGVQGARGCALCLCRPARRHQPASYQHLCARCATADDVSANARTSKREA